MSNGSLHLSFKYKNSINIVYLFLHLFKNTSPLFLTDILDENHLVHDRQYFNTLKKVK